MKKKHSFLKKRNKLRLMSLFFLLLSSLLGQAQAPQKTLVKGIVVDESGNPIIGATIVGDIATGTITNLNGDFQISLPASVKLLTISYIGYVEQKIPINNRTFIKIILKEDVKSLSEVVVVGYGAQKKETLTGSISSVQTKSLIQSPTANVGNALVGRVAGIVSTQSSGEAGFDAATIRIRGVATFAGEQSQSPLVVIDGVQSSVLAMNALDPHEIESVNVLKDASSTAVYGVRGANGVIIVTTKRGDTGKPSINFSYRYGVTRPVSLLKMLNAYDYASYRNEAILSDKNAGKYSALFSDDDLWKFRYNRDYTPEEIEIMDLTDSQKEQLANSPALYYASHDYIAEQFDHDAPQQQYNINVSGGSEKVKYFFSLGNLNQKGNFNTDYRGYSVNSDYDRYNLRSNLDIDIYKNLKLTVDFGGQFSKTTGIMGSSADGLMAEYARHKAMLVNILANTPFVGPGIIDDKLVTGYVSSKSPLQSKGGYGYSAMTALFSTNMLTTNLSRLNTNIRLKHTMDYLTKGLSVTGTVSYNDSYKKGTVTENHVPTYSVYRSSENPNELIFTGGIEYPKTVYDNQYNSKWNQIYLEGKVDYSRKFGRHAFTGMYVATAQKTFDPSLQYKVPAGLLGFATRLTYNYDNRYLAEFNAGYNGSENFPKNKRFGFFPAYSLGWIVTNEKFIPKNDLLSWMKIRGSYGQVGNDKIGSNRFLYLPNAWGYLPQYTSGNNYSYGYSFGTTDGSSKDPYYAGAYESYVGNPDVIWERARKLNIGLDVNFFRDRLQFVGDFFYEKRDNILWTLEMVPDIVAANLPPANIGKMTNKGYEIQLKWNDKIFHDLYYNIGLNLSYAINRIDYKDEPAFLYEWMNETGFSYKQYKGYRTAGFYDTVDEVSNRPYVDVDGNKVQTGDFRYIDIDGDGKIDKNDRVPIGYSNMPRYSFGGNFDIEYKGFSLSLLFTGSYKGSIPLTSTYILNPFYMTNGAAFYFQYDNHWTPEKAAQGIASTFPRASLRTYDSQNGVMNDMWLYSTQFLRLKNAELAYNITKLGKLKDIGFSNIRIYLSGSNLFTWGSKLPSGFDPEQEDSNGASYGYLYPPTRTLNFGISIKY